MAGGIKRRNVGPDLQDQEGASAPRIARQERSFARIEQLLDAAATVLARSGLEPATMTDVALEAGTAIGTLYRWFPEKDHLIRALGRRLLDQFWIELAPRLEDRPDESSWVLIERALEVMARFAARNPAFTVLLTADPRSGSDLHESLIKSTALLVEQRVPGIDELERDVVADTVVAIACQMLNAFERWPKKHRTLIINEHRYVLTAYLGMKYPGPDNPLWTVDGLAIQPSRVGRVVAAAITDVEDC